MIVRSVGPQDSPLLAIVGEAPGREEALKGLPFIGAAGYLLDQMLSSCGISRSECFITNVVNERPPNNNFGIFYSDKKLTMPTSALIEHRKRLLSQLNEVQPKIIIAMGNEALKATTMKSGIKNQRGKIITVTEPFHPVIVKRHVLPTYHPAYINRVYGDRPIVELDLKKAVRYAREGVPKTEVHFNVSPTFDDVMDFISARHSPVAFDIETIGNPPTTRTLGFSWSGTEAISIPLIRHGTHYWRSHEEEIILQSLKDYLGDPEIGKYLQNAPFDCTVVERELGLHVDGVVLDTMFSHHLLYPELPKSLDFLTSIHTDFPIYWEEKGAGDVQNATYNCYDCCVTWIAAQNILQELKDRNLLDFYYKEIHPAWQTLTRMQNRGIKIDVKEREAEGIKVEAKMAEILEALRTATTNDTFNPSSPKQVKELVYGKWNLPPQRSPTTKNITTDDDALRALARKNPFYAPILKKIIKYRSLRTRLSTFITSVLGPGNRTYTSFNLAGAVTGRISSSKTIEGYGGNLMNIPRGSFRRVFVPDDGKVWIKSDLERAEYYCWCWFAGCYELIERFTADPHFDCHRLNASQVFEIPESEVTKKQRQDGKNGIYAASYGVGPLKISRLHDIDFQRAKQIVENYKRARPELLLWWRQIQDEIKTTRTLRNPLGRERIFFGRMDDSTFRAAYSHTCQSTVADIILQALVELDSLGVELLLQVHDEIDCQCLPEEVPDVVAKLKKAMEIPINVPGIPQPLVIPTEIQVGPNWYELKPYEEWLNENKTLQRHDLPTG